MAARSMDHLPRPSLHNPLTTLYTGYAVGLTGVGLGLAGIFAPSLFADLFGVPVPTSSPATHFPYIQAMGMRDISISLTYFILGLQRNVEGIGAVMVCHGLIGVGDAVVTWRKGIRTSAWFHLAAAGVACGLGGGILGYFG